MTIRSQVYPCIFYNDAPAAIEWLVRVFGFERHFIAEAPDGSIAHAELRFGQGVIMVGQARSERGWASPRELPAVNQAVYAALDDVDALYERVKTAGAEILMEIYDSDHGSRDFAVRDLEGHPWYFGSYFPHV